MYTKNRYKKCYSGVIQLRIGYIAVGIFTGLFLCFSFLTTIPDGKLHMVFCDVGQGDGIYVRFPDGKDMVVDGGPGERIIQCLSRHMPFWDRTIDLVVLTHPDADHLTGLLSVLKRYKVQYVVRSDVEHTSKTYQAFQTLIQEHGIAQKLVEAGQDITVGDVVLSVIWPSHAHILSMKPAYAQTSSNVLGVASTAARNEGSVVLLLSYGNFDALLTGDADSRVQPAMMKFLQHRLAGSVVSDGIVDILKVPHHGSKTGMTDAFLEKISFKGGGPSKLNIMAGLQPLAVISVGKNSYGHPADQILDRLKQAGFSMMRTDLDGSVKIVTDGHTWQVQ